MSYLFQTKSWWFTLLRVFLLPTALWLTIILARLAWLHLSSLAKADFAPPSAFHKEDTLKSHVTDMATSTNILALLYAHNRKTIDYSILIQLFGTEQP